MNGFDLCHKYILYLYLNGWRKNGRWHTHASYQPMDRKHRATFSMFHTQQQRAKAPNQINQINHQSNQTAARTCATAPRVPPWRWVLHVNAPRGEDEAHQQEDGEPGEPNDHLSKRVAVRGGGRHRRRDMTRVGTARTRGPGPAARTRAEEESEHRTRSNQNKERAI